MCWAKTVSCESGKERVQLLNALGPVFPEGNWYALCELTWRMPEPFAGKTPVSTVSVKSCVAFRLLWYTAKRIGMFPINRDRLDVLLPLLEKERILAVLITRPSEHAEVFFEPEAFREYEKNPYWESIVDRRECTLIFFDDRAQCDFVDFLAPPGMSEGISSAVGIWETIWERSSQR